MIELTEQHQRELEADKDSQPRIYNPRTRETFVLVPAYIYDRIRPHLGEGVFATAESVDQVMAKDDALDPYLEEYQRLYGGDQS